MNVTDKEHYDLMDHFESEFPGRTDKEEKNLWRKGVIYQDGRVNDLFLSFRRGYAYAKITAYGDGFQDGEIKGFRSGYSDALADAKNKLCDLVGSAISDLDKDQS